MATTMRRALGILRAYWRAENSTPEGQWNLLWEVILGGVVRCRRQRHSEIRVKRAQV